MFEKLTFTQLTNTIFRILWQKFPFRVKSPKLNYRPYGPRVQRLVLRSTLLADHMLLSVTMCPAFGLQTKIAYLCIYRPQTRATYHPIFNWKEMFNTDVCKFLLNARFIAWNVHTLLKSKVVTLYLQHNETSRLFSSWPELWAKISTSEKQVHIKLMKHMPLSQGAWYSTGLHDMHVKAIRCKSRFKKILPNWNFRPCSMLSKQSQHIS
jgi:hypothetical protein